MNPNLTVCDAFDSQTDSTEESDTKVQWAELPSIPLEKVYSFLSRGDQINMSQVCRQWSEGFNSPAVWQNFRFSLTESELSMDHCPKIKCAEKYSRMFRHVEIDIVRNFDEHLIETWCRRLKVFLDILSGNSQLTSLKVRWPENFFLFNTMTCAKDLQNHIEGFVHDQKIGSFESEPKRVKIGFHSYYFFSPLAGLLNLWAEEKILEFPMHFVLRRFVNNIAPMDQENTAVSQDLHTLLCQKSEIFRMLSNLQTEYSFIFERMPASQSADIDKLRSSLPSKIILSCYGSIQQHHQGLESDSWRFLKQLYPDIQVEMYFETDSQSRREVEFFIVPDIPITQLEYSFSVCKSEHSSIMEIDALLNHLLTCKTNEHLVSLRLAWILPIPDLASTFIQFLQAFKKLKCLQIFIVYPANGIDRLLRSWLEIRPESLEKVFIDISDIGNEDNSSSLMNTVGEFIMDSLPYEMDSDLSVLVTSEGFNSPAVWKNFRFSLTESELSMDPCPKIKCAEKYSRMFRHVEIDRIRNVDGASD
ncbi:hypothetical protein AVEN_1599-1 [Araneus ventricosus]|uniref:F-box domain-containing protein n=1 Tax=Araneus ventricosus TaxID=182803 RepID=A0A4Y2DTE5_ARAVE|nr:hypothetical protein AVEN_1599-1 [Araneus ventricosus]